MNPIDLEDLIACEKCGIVLYLPALKQTPLNKNAVHADLECPLCKASEVYAVDQVLERFGLTEGDYEFSMEHYESQENHNKIGVPSRITLIKTLRTYFDCGLKEAKDCTEGSRTIAGRLSGENVRRFKEELGQYKLTRYRFKKIKD